MTVKLQVLLATAAGVFSACAPVSNETFSTITVEGRPYELRTRTIDGPNGPYETSSVLVRNNYYLCKPDSPGDCEAAVKTGQNGSDRD